LWLKVNESQIPEIERSLAVRAIAGDRLAFSHLVEIHRPGLISVATRILRNGEDANDAVQETVYKAFRSIRSFQPGKPVKPWLYRICSNCCVDVNRSRRRDSNQLEDEDEIADIGLSVDEEVGANDIRRQVLEAIFRLPSRYRKIIFMRHFRYMDVSEIADVLERPEGTIKSWLFRARELLKQDLEPVFS
jgi:RNA polymerase sigma-70 factor (ECF subfamily)